MSEYKPEEAGKRGVEFIRKLIKSEKAKDFIRKYISESPETGEPLDIIDLQGAESGHDGLVIIAEGYDSKWKYTITTEEI